MSYHLDIQTQIGPACVRAKCFVVKWLELLSTGKSLCFHGLKTILVNVNFTFCFWNFLTWAFNFIHQSMAYTYLDSQIESKSVVPTINNILFLIKQRTNWNEKNTFFGFSNACVLRCFFLFIFCSVFIFFGTYRLFASSGELFENVILLFKATQFQSTFKITDYRRF